MLGLALVASASRPYVASGGPHQKVATAVRQPRSHQVLASEISAGKERKLSKGHDVFHTAFAQRMLRFRGFSGDFSSVSPLKSIRLRKDKPSRAPMVARGAAPGNAPDIYGAVIYAYKSDISPVGFYKVPTGDTPDALTMISKADYDISGATCGIWHDDAYLMMNLAYFYGDYYPELDVFDINTGECQLFSDLEPTDFAYNLAVDPVTDVVYGLFLNESGTDFDLGIFDVDELTANHIAPLYGLDAAGIAFTPDGKLYCLDKDGRLYTVNKSSGVTALVAETDAVSEYYSTLVGDPTENVLYFIGAEDSGSYLYRIDPVDGSCEYLYAMPNDEEVVGGFVMPEAIPSAAPAQVSGLVAEFEPGSLSGKVSFVMPSETVDGNSLSGTLDYTVAANGVTCASSSAAAGSAVDVDVTLQTSDLYAFVVTCSNEAGKGKKAVCTSFVGQDSPKAPTGVQLSLSGNTLTLTWNAVEESKFGGDIDTDKVSYAVTPYVDGEAGATVTGVGATSYTMTIDGDPDRVVRYAFGVATEYDGEVSTAMTLSNTCMAGAYPTPYSYSFTTQKDMNDSFTVIDANEDGVKWHVATDEYMNEDNEYVPVAMIDYNSDEDLDDWLITSPLRLEAGSRYVLTFNALPGLDEMMEVFCGTEPSAGGMTQCIKEQFLLDEAYELVEYSVPFTVDADGKYFIGFHAVSEADNFYIYLNDIAVSAPVRLEAPEAASITATALPDKALGATITVVAPVSTLMGNELDELEKIELYREDTLIHTFTSVVPGETYEFVDNGASQGDNTYKAIAYNEGGPSAESTCTVYVGVGKPVEPENVRIVEIEQGKVRITWDAVTADELGNTLTADDVTYIVAEYYSAQKMYVRASGLTSPEFEYVVAEGDYQTFTQFAVFASTIAGNGYGTLSPSIPVGKPYDMPYEETFADGTAAHGYVFNDITAGGSWRMFNDSSIQGVSDADGNNGYLGLIGDAAGQSSQLLSGKIALSGDNPTLSFYLYGQGSADANELNVSVITSEGTTEVLALTANTDGWTQYLVSVKEFTGQTIQLGFTGTIRTYTVVLIDGISVFDGVEHDLGAESISAPEMAMANSVHNVTVTVRNRGTAASGDFTVDLYANGEKYLSSEVGSLEPNSAVNVKFEAEFSVLSPAVTEYYAEFVSALDTKPENNRTPSVAVALKDSGMPSVGNLEGEVNNGAVTLTWSAADDYLTPEVETEDFEKYDAYSSEMGEWTLVDNDGMPGGGINGADIPGYISGMSTISYLVLNSELNLGAAFTPHSGDQFISNMYRADDGVVSDWIISPELNGMAQTISLYARSYTASYPESFRVLASSTDRELGSFVEVVSFKSIGAEWTKFEAELPAGTRFFAIETFSEGSFFISFDDITYAPLRKVYSPVGYNVYRDGELITEQPVVGTTFTDANVSEGIYSYCVTSVYAIGESAPCGPVSVNVTSSGIGEVIPDADADEMFFDVRGIRTDGNASGVLLRVKGNKVEKIYKRN